MGRSADLFGLPETIPDILSPAPPGRPSPVVTILVGTW
jgi:hypothetical protein